MIPATKGDQGGGYRPPVQLELFPMTREEIIFRDFLAEVLIDLDKRTPK